MEHLIGTWFIAELSPDEEGILVMAREGRAIQFSTAKTKPRFSETMRLWWSGEGSNSVRFRPSPLAEGWLREVEICGPHRTLIAVQHGSKFRFPCRHASREFLPPWFDELLERNLALMIEEDQRR